VGIKHLIGLTFDLSKSTELFGFCQANQWVGVGTLTRVQLRTNASALLSIESAARQAH
jgi:hypothetical protein